MSKSYFRKKLDDFKDGFWQWCQILLIAAIPIFFLESHIADNILVNDKVKADGVELLVYYAVRQGDLAVSILLTLMLIKFFYKIHDKKLLNVGMLYHDHGVWYYRFCANLLGYKRCSLIRVPIDMQFQLVMNDCFDEYDDGGDDTYKRIEHEDIQIKRIHSTNCGRVINLCIEDTYPIKEEYIPDELKQNETIMISRYTEEQRGIRCDSKSLVEKVAKTITDLPEGRYTVNIMATTNVRNTIRIAKDVFKTGGRGNVSCLNVYRQPNGSDNKWEFSCPTKVFG